VHIVGRIILIIIGGYIGSIGERNHGNDTRGSNVENVRRNSEYLPEESVGNKGEGITARILQYGNIVYSCREGTIDVDESSISVDGIYYILEFGRISYELINGVGIAHYISKIHRITGIIASIVDLDIEIRHFLIDAG
jgi:hypothetical protein